MRNPPRDRFSLIDAMILVAGIAVGMALVRGLSPEQFLRPYAPVSSMSKDWGRPWNGKEWISWFVNTGSSRFNYLMPLLAALSATVLLIRLRAPRPRRARLMQQPGTVAMAAALIIAALRSTLIVVSNLRQRINHMEYQFYYLGMTTSIASAVISSWMTLLVSGRWRADPGWCDRLGRFLGILWLFPFLVLIYQSLRLL